MGTSSLYSDNEIRGKDFDNILTVLSMYYFVVCINWCALLTQINDKQISYYQTYLLEWDRFSESERIKAITTRNVKAQVISFFIHKNKLLRQWVLLFFEKDHVDLVAVEDVLFKYQIGINIAVSFSSNMLYTEYELLW